MAAPYPGSRKRPTVTRTLAAEFLMLVMERAIKAGGFIREERITFFDYDFSRFRGEDLVKQLVERMSYVLGGMWRADQDVMKARPDIVQFVRDFLEAHRKELAEIELTRQEKAVKA